MIYDYYLFLSSSEGNEISVIAEIKRDMRTKSKGDKEIRVLYPDKDDLQGLPQGTVLIKISFVLEKPYTSKDEGEFHIMDNRIFENPIVRDKFTGLPMVRPSSWKGHLRFAAERVERGEKEKREIIRRLFGTEPGESESLKGRLYFFPTFFKDEAERDVITPLRRDTRTPVEGRAPVTLEVMKPGREGDFYILYFPYPKGRDFKKEQVKEDLIFLAEALKLMFYVYGFSAKKTSGFGVIERELKEGKMWMNSGAGIEEEVFSDLDELLNQFKLWREKG